MSEILDLKNDFKGDFLVITSEFPLDESKNKNDVDTDDKKNLGFLVKKKIKQYREAGFKVDTILANIRDANSKYAIGGGYNIYKVSFDDMRNVIQRRKYKKILVFGLSPEIVHAVVACDLDGIEVLAHVEEGCEYLGNLAIREKYEKKNSGVTELNNEVNNVRLDATKILANNTSVRWVLESEEEYKRITKETGIDFKKYSIIPFTNEGLGRTEEKLLKSKNKNVNRLERRGRGRRNIEPILTVMIPAYNVEQYIENTIKSVVNIGNINALELIIINDGSTDKTERIVKRIIKNSSEDVRKAIVYVKQANGGHGAAVDKGLELAKGKFFRILDADDRFDSEELNRHIDVLKKTKADAVFTDVVKDFSIGSVYAKDQRYRYMKPGVVYNFEELYKQHGDEGFNGPSIMTTTIRTDKLRKSGCHHPRKVSYDDMILCYFMLKSIETIEYDARFLHYYYIGREGQSTSIDSYKRKFGEHLLISEKLIQLLETGDLTDGKAEYQLKHRVDEALRHDYLVALEICHDYDKFKQIETMLKKYPEYYNNESLVPEYVVKMRKYGHMYFVMRKFKAKMGRY